MQTQKNQQKPFLAVLMFIFSKVVVQTGLARMRIQTKPGGGIHGLVRSRKKNAHWLEPPPGGRGVSVFRNCGNIGHEILTLTLFLVRRFQRTAKLHSVIITKTNKEGGNNIVWSFIGL